MFVKKQKSFYPLIVLLGMLTACYNVMPLNVADGYDAALEDATERAVFSPVNAAINLTVVSSAAVGCLINPEENEEKAEKYGSMVCPLTQVEGDQEQASEKLKSDLIADENKNGAFLFTAFADVVQRSLQRQLKSHFANANVAIAGQSGSGLKVKPTGELRWGPSIFHKNNSFITLEAIPAKGNPIKIVGTGETQFKVINLCWGLPLGCIVFPITLPTVSLIFRSIFEGKLEESVARGIDDAAQKLVQKLADYHRKHADAPTDWQVIVRLEQGDCVDQ